MCGTGAMLAYLSGEFSSVFVRQSEDTRYSCYKTSDRSAGAYRSSGTVVRDAYGIFWDPNK